MGGWFNNATCPGNIAPSLKISSAFLNPFIAKYDDKANLLLIISSFSFSAILFLYKSPYMNGLNFLKFGFFFAIILAIIALFSNFLSYSFSFLERFILFLINPPYIIFAIRLLY